MKPNPNETTVLLLHQDGKLREDLYLAFLRTVPHLTSLPGELPPHLEGVVAAIRELSNAPANLGPENVERLRGLLLRVEAGMSHEDAVEEVREFAARAFTGGANAADYSEDLETLHEGVIPNTHGTPTDLDAVDRETAWTEWRADRARLKEAGSVLDSDLDVLMTQLWVEGVDVEEAEAAVVDLLTRDSDTRLKRELMKLDRKERAKTLGDLASLALKTPPA